MESMPEFAGDLSIERLADSELEKTTVRVVSHTPDPEEGQSFGCDDLLGSKRPWTGSTEV